MLHDVLEVMLNVPVQLAAYPNAKVVGAAVNVMLANLICVIVIFCAVAPGAVNVSVADRGLTVTLLGETVKEAFPLPEVELRLSQEGTPDMLHVVFEVIPSCLLSLVEFRSVIDDGAVRIVVTSDVLYPSTKLLEVLPLVRSKLFNAPEIFSDDDAIEFSVVIVVLLPFATP